MTTQMISPQNGVADYQPISHVVNATGELEVGGCKASDLIAQHGTPLYVMDEQTIRKQCQVYRDTISASYPDALVIFAGKACLNTAMVRLLASESLGLDVVSSGELYTALKGNMPADRIFFHGNNKSCDEIEMAIEAGVCLVVDNEQELDNIIQIASTKSKKVPLLLRLKPEIEAHTHEYIKTCQIDSKFGIDKGELSRFIRRIQATPSLELLGLHSHIGSQIFDVHPFKDLVDLMVDKMVEIRDEFGIELRVLDLGGGVGIHYTTEDDPPIVPDFLEGMTTRLKEACESKSLRLPKLIVEPGRSLVGRAGMTLYDIGTIKEIPNIKTYIFVDGGMADNPRPIMYQADYTFGLANKLNQVATETYTIAGKYCESGDILGKDIALPKAKKGDTLVVYGTGAYNYSMASNYNRACRPAMVLVNDGQSTVMVKRETFEDLTRLDAE